MTLSEHMKFQVTENSHFFAIDTFIQSLAGSQLLL